jgi:nucleoside-diphosphate-sugar epimerase
MEAGIMKVLVTGGTGNVGRAAVERLVRHGHTVRVIGRRANTVIEGAEYRQCDVTDLDELIRVMDGIEAVVHLAAIPHPSKGSGPEIFHINCDGTYHVYEAAAIHGTRRVVTASSINAFGYNFGIKNFDLLYFPVDEEHPACTTDPYSFSKQVTEAIADYYWRREGISGVCLRLPAVYEVNAGGETYFYRFADNVARGVARLLDLPDTERRKRADDLIRRFEALRVERAWERPGGGRSPYDDLDAALMFGRSNFWTSIDARDSAQAIEKALLAGYTGSHPLFVNDRYNMVGVDSETLLNLFFPEVEGRKKSLQGDETLVSIDKARALIGYEPEHSLPTGDLFPKRR